MILPINACFREKPDLSQQYYYNSVMFDLEWVRLTEDILRVACAYPKDNQPTNQDCAFTLPI